MVAETDTVINLRQVILFFIFMLLAGCSQEHDFGTASKSDNIPLRSNNNDHKAVITIGPLNATISSMITLKTGNIKLDSRSIIWSVNGIPDNTSKGYQFITDMLRKGDVVQAVGTNNQKEYLSNELVIRNSPPSITKAKLLPEFPNISSTLTVDVNARDADHDRIYYRYKWFLNGDYAGEDRILEAELKRGDEVSVEVIPEDGEDIGKSVRLKSRILNSHPVVNDSSPNFNGQTYTHLLNITDPDNDSLSYALKKGPQEMTIDPTKGVMTWEVTPADKGYHEIEVVVDDNHGGEILIPFTAMIGFE